MEDSAYVSSRKLSPLIGWLSRATGELVSTLLAHRIGCTCDERVAQLALPVGAGDELVRPLLVLVLLLLLPRLALPAIGPPLVRVPVLQITPQLEGPRAPPLLPLLPLRASTHAHLRSLSRSTGHSFGHTFGPPVTLSVLRSLSFGHSFGPP
eukprot:263382-Prorocentrum_minimum.AAC.1